VHNHGDRQRPIDHGCTARPGARKDLMMPALLAPSPFPALSPFPFPPPPGPTFDAGAAERGAVTAEYAIATIAAVGFAALLVVVLRSDEVRGMLAALIRHALAIPG
jgi:Protein of unknown function (DUF4244)